MLYNIVFDKAYFIPLRVQCLMRRASIVVLLIEFLIDISNSTIEKGLQMNIYVGNLSYDAGEDDVRSAFEEHGEVASVKLISDKYTNRSKGFGFVEMPDDESAQKAIDALDGTEIKGRPVRVNKARPPKKYPDRGPGRDS